MSALILHHYPLSPFAMKVRAMLGYAQLSWQSCRTAAMPPRAHLSALAGGYRRIPVAQDGADVYCDSKVIAEEIAQRSGLNALALDHCDDAVREYVQTVDFDVFFACIHCAQAAGLAQTLRRELSLLGILRLVWDRKRIAKTAVAKVGDPRKSRQRVLDHLADIEQRVAASNFLFGAKPNHADFSAYHSLWFMTELGKSRLVDSFPRTIDWMQRMRAFGEGTRQEITVRDALDAAKNATPKPIAAAHQADSRIGTPVRISPSDYTLDATEGKLFAVTPTRLIVARTASKLGTIHVHFPQRGYSLAVI